MKVVTPMAKFIFSRKVMNQSESLAFTGHGYRGYIPQENDELIPEEEQNVANPIIKSDENGFPKAGKRKRSPTSERSSKHQGVVNMAEVIAGDSLGGEGYKPAGDTSYPPDLEASSSGSEAMEHVAEDEDSHGSPKLETGDEENRNKVIGNGLPLRWGQKKRLRFSKPEIRSGGEELELEGGRRKNNRSMTATGMGTLGSTMESTAVFVVVDQLDQDMAQMRHTEAEQQQLENTIEESTAATSKKLEAQLTSVQQDQGLDKEFVRKRYGMRLKGKGSNFNHTVSCRNQEEAGAIVTSQSNFVNNHLESQEGSGDPVQANGNVMAEPGFHDRRYLQHCLVAQELIELPKFLLSLSRSEKEDDFLKIKGSKLPQRPKKRAKFVEKSLQRLLPGAWLCNLKRERYEVRERKVAKKKARGLKSLHGLDSESDE